MGKKGKGRKRAQTDEENAEPSQKALRTKVIEYLK